MPDEQRLTVWTVKVTPDVTVRLEDIAIEGFAEAEKRTGSGWLVLVGSPLRSSASALEMYRLACRHAGIEPVDGLNVRQIIDKFALVEDDRPTLYEAGLPAPKADETETVGSPI
jgi:hypothetical protein